MTHQPQLIPDQPSPGQAARDAERAEYLERLREKLKDPEFRAIEGFPIGEDEDILALSDPPYYTACPNPFLPEILERWQAERAQIREELGLPDDANDVGRDNGDNGRPVYHREPFAADVSQGKGDRIYGAHPYHTKVPHEAIMRYILHYTDPGDVVFDGFCGTGMTGVAAQLCADKKTVESLGFRVTGSGDCLPADSAQASPGARPPKLGARKAVLVDLCPVATLVAHNYNLPVSPSTFTHQARHILRDAEEKWAWMYETSHRDGKTKGRINFTIWSDVFLCPECSAEIVFWDVAVDSDAGKVRDSFFCPSCNAELTKRSLERVWEAVYDSALGQMAHKTKQVPVSINYSVGKQRYKKEPDADDLALIQQINERQFTFRFPIDPIPKGDKTTDPINVGITHTHHFYTKRNLWLLAYLMDSLRSGKSLGLFWFTSASVWCQRTARLQMANYFKGGGGVVVPTLPGTLYVGSVTIETNVMERFRLRTRIASALDFPKHYGSVAVITGSSTNLTLPESSIDYIFVDPPFGGNLMYSELNFLWEAWLRIFTNNGPEAVVNKTQQKGLTEYQRLMENCFGEFHRVLKPGRWMTIEFHNSQNSVWNAIQEALLRSGFVVADVRTFDKQKGTFNQVTSTGAVKQDLVISAYKPRSGFERRFREQAGSAEGAWDFVRQHLAQLPVVVHGEPHAPTPNAQPPTRNSKLPTRSLEVVAERQAYLLYDRMVAFHIQRGFSVPLGAAEFYAGLKQRFPERDEMYFLPDQAAEYDRERMRAVKVEQLALFVTDEKSALQWLRRELDPETGAGPQTYQDLQPKFLRELHQARHEDLPELSEMLAQNFLKDEGERWYVPDPGRQGDLEKLRERALLREFSEYAQGRGRLKVFRTEAVRAGFKHAWHERDYALIVKVADRLPPSVLQEDAGLLMYYDNALMRAEAEPVQGRLM